MTPLLLVLGPARADLVPPASAGFVAEEPRPPRLPPHPFGVSQGAFAVGLLLVAAVLGARWVRRHKERSTI